MMWYNLKNAEENMSGRLIIDGNAVYEIDGDCMCEKSEYEEKQKRNYRMKHQDYEGNVENDSNEDSEAKTDDKSNSDSE